VLKLARAWEVMLLEKFGGDGSALPCDVTDATVCFTDVIPQRSPIDVFSTRIVFTAWKHY
jgi:hypothetical protein